MYSAELFLCKVLAVSNWYSSTLDTSSERYAGECRHMHTWPDWRRERFEWHVANLREVNTSMDRLSLSIRSAIAREDRKTEFALTHYYTLALGMWAEVRLLKLLHEHRVFNAKIIAGLPKDQITRWKSIVDLSFRKHFKVSELTIDTLRFNKFMQYKELIERLGTELSPVIVLRNRLAHGQLRYTLIEDCSSLNETLMQQLHRENIMTLQLKRRLLDHIARIIHALIVFHPNFNMIFDRHYAVVLDSARQIKRNKFKDYRTCLRERYVRGKDWQKKKTNADSQ